MKHFCQSILRLRILLLTLALLLWVTTHASANEATDWIITNKLNGITHNTLSHDTTIKGMREKGLVGVVEKGGRQLKMYWEKGAANQTIELDGVTLVEGQFNDSAYRLSSIRLSKSGSLVYLRSSKGPKSKVWLVQDGTEVQNWPRRTNIRIVSFDTSTIVFALFKRLENTLELFSYSLNENGIIDPATKKVLGKAQGCLLTSAAFTSPNLHVELICDGATGRDVFKMNENGEAEPVLAGEKDDMLMTSLLRKHDPSRTFKSHIGVLSVQGSPDAVRFYSAVNALLLRQLGEPVSMSSDEAGKQSWNQSYRTQTLATLYQKTKHTVFASLARNAMRETASTTNGTMKISGASNPTCGWASRIYSSDKKTAASFFINQSIITSSLMQSCKALGGFCDREMKKRITQINLCLVEHYEKQFDEDEGLYRIAKGVPFRFDGIWAPWNWQVSMAVLLESAALNTGYKLYKTRAHDIRSNFLKAMEIGSGGALWRYWPSRYYKGWSANDRISNSKPTQKARPADQYEDLNHAGISLAALCKWPVPKKLRAAIKARLDTLLGEGNVFPRYIDGTGPKSATWQLAHGWDCFGGTDLSNRFSKILASAAYGPTLLSYANQFEEKGQFDLRLNLSACGSEGCKQAKSWHFTSLQDYLDQSPFFSLAPIR